MPKINLRRCSVPILLLAFHITAGFLQASQMVIRENPTEERNERNGELPKSSHRFSNFDTYDSYSRELETIRHGNKIEIEVTANTPRHEKHNSLWPISSPVKRSAEKESVLARTQGAYCQVQSIEGEA